ncbi:MAG: hypothetical protein A3G22_05650 [Alphaproteobacteria bacterium RIFCSPLOWO2_12_FULL_40_11]|nr:MAG: hypothetical protein A3G22_05650 [Alphaproteobacteria bacterium RIFCSPLOWO2_12_FULL_40_11]
MPHILIEHSTAAFLHITIKILSGRTLEARKKLSQNVIQFAEKFFKDLKITKNRCDISVDVVEMDRETYSKLRIGVD